MASHKYRAQKLLESHGWIVADVESWIPGTKIKRDLFGFADLLAINEDGRTLALQVTSANGGNVAARQAKVLESPNSMVCLMCNWIVEVWGIRDSPTKNGGTVDSRRILLPGKAERGSVVLPGNLTA